MTQGYSDAFPGLTEQQIRENRRMERRVILGAYLVGEIDYDTWSVATRALGY